MAVVGRATVTILADVTRFGARLGKDLNKIIAKARIDTGPLEKQVEKGFKDAAKLGEKAIRQVEKASRDSFRAAGNIAAVELSDIAQAADRALSQVSRQAADTGDDLGDRVKAGADKAARALGAVTRAAIKTQTTLALVTLASAGLMAVSASLAAGVNAVVGALAATANAIPGIVGSLAALAAIVGTLKVAMAGMGAAFSAALGDDAAKFDQAIENLSPHAQKAAQALRSLKPEFDAIKSTVQDEFWEDFDGLILSMAGSLAGPLKDGMATTARGLGTLVYGIGEVLASADGVTLIETAFDSAALAIDKMTAPLANLTQGLIDMTTSGLWGFDAFVDKIAAGTDALGTFFTRVSEVGFGQALGEVFDPGEILAGLSDLLTKALDSIATAVPKMAQNFLAGREAFFAAVLDVFTAIVEVLPVILPDVLLAVFGLIGSIATTLAGAAPLLATTAIDLFKNIVSGIKDTLPLVIESAGTVVQELIRALVDIAPLLVEGAAALIIGLVEGIAENLPMILDGALEIVSGLLMGILEQVPALIDAGLTLMESLVTGLVEFLPKLAEFVISDLLPTLLETISTQLPKILETGMELLTQLLFGLLEALPQIQLFITTDLLPALIKALITLAPIMITTGLTLLTSLVEGFTEFLPQLITFITETFIPTLIDTFIEEMPLIIETGITVIEALIQGFSDAAPQIWDMIVNELIPGVVKAALKGGASLGRAAGQWVQDMLIKLRNNGPEIWAWFKALPGKILSAIGKLDRLLLDKAAEIIKGFVDGIRNKFGEVKDAFGQLTKFIPDWKGPSAVDRVLLRGPARVIMGGFADDLLRQANDVVRPALASIGRDMSAQISLNAPASIAGLSQATAPVITKVGSSTPAAPAEVYVGTALIDLGDGITQAVDLRFTRAARDLKRRAATGPGAVR